MEKLVETIAKALVDKPDEVTVQDIGESDRNEEILQLSVASDDMGKVIGKQGGIAKALRTVVKAAATKERRMINVEIVSNEEMAEAANAAGTDDAGEVAEAANAAGTDDAGEVAEAAIAENATEDEGAAEADDAADADNTEKAAESEDAEE